MTTLQARAPGIRCSVSVGGVRMRATLPDHRAARLWRAQTEAALLAGELPSGGRSGVTTLVEAVRGCLRHVYAGTANELKAASHLRMLVEAVGDMPIQRLDRKALARVAQQWREEGIRSTTLNRRRATCMRMLRWAYEQGHLAAVPPWPAEEIRIVNGKREGRRTRWLSDKEAGALLSALWPQADTAPYLLTWLLLNTGLRLGEALRLCAKDVDFDHMVIHVRKSKTGEQRTVPFREGANLASLVEAIGDGCVSDIVDERGYRAAFARAAEEAGLGDDPEVVPHCLRHTYATRLVAKGVPIHAVSKVLGHASVTTTERYAHAAPAALDAVRDALEGA